MKAPHTIFGIPVRLSADAEKGIIVMHPETFSEIEAIAFRTMPVHISCAPDIASVAEKLFPDAKVN